MFASSNAHQNLLNANKSGGSERPGKERGSEQGGGFGLSFLMPLCVAALIVCDV